jgi:hypothetical protein
VRSFFLETGPQTIVECISTTEKISRKEKLWLLEYNIGLEKNKQLTPLDQDQPITQFCRTVLAQPPRRLESHIFQNRIMDEEIFTNNNGI